MNSLVFYKTGIMLLDKTCNLTLIVQCLRSTPMQIERPGYINELSIRKHNGMIKVVTGIRRCGKSYLLLKLFHNELLKSGVKDDHILEIALDDFDNIPMRKPEALLSWLKSQLTDSLQYYLILDEVQLLDHFVDVLNSCLHIDNLDVYVTGSNSRFLSTDVITEFRGRGDEIHVFPLSFSEFMSGCGLPQDRALKDYLQYGGLPYVLSCQTPKQKMDYLDHVRKEVYLRDVAERNRIQHAPELEELLHFYASSIGALSSLRKLSDTFKSVKNIQLSIGTIGSYSNYLAEAFIIQRAKRYDIKGKRYIDSPSKVYFEDLGIRNACLDFRQTEPNHLMENLIYNELRARGFLVDVGAMTVREKNEDGKLQQKQLEIDFIANQGDSRYYIQSVYQIPDDSKRDQEYRPLLKIDDSFRKVVITYNDVPSYTNDYGILTIGLPDFLLNPQSLNL
jgi:predicted AAA+ superfamily ATPase